MPTVSMQRLLGRGALVALVLVAVPFAGGVAGAVTHDVAIPLLRVEHADVRPGGTVIAHGSGFAPHAHVKLMAARGKHAAHVIGSAFTGRSGGFRAAIAIAARSAPGTYALIACRDRCRIHARTGFRVLHP